MKVTNWKLQLNGEVLHKTGSLRVFFNTRKVGLAAYYPEGAYSTATREKALTRAREQLGPEVELVRAGDTEIIYV